MAEGVLSQRDPAASAGRLVLSPGGVVALGAVGVVAGVVVLAWPGATLLVIAVTFAIFLFVTGVFRLVAALASVEPSGSGRALLAIVGALSILLGILFLRRPFETLAVLVLLLGLFWIVAGALEIVHALGSPGLPGRSWSIGAGVVSLAAGIVVLVFPSATLVVLVWLVGLQLLCYGAITVARGVLARRDQRLPSAARRAPQPRSSPT